MRLIDADKLVVDARLGDDEIPYVSKTQIDEEPTVEAIPIEWVKKWVKNWKPYTNVKSDVFYMLEEWEKENGG